MAILQILWYPDERLLQAANSVADFDSALEKYVADLLETMYHDEGCGLASTQVGVALRVLVLDMSQDGSDPRYFINPEFVQTKGSVLMPEGCLSLPGIAVPVERPEWIKIKYQNLQGDVLNLETGGYLARCLQHEMDHLDGKLSIDHVTPFKRSRFLKKLEKEKKRELASKRDPYWP